MKYGLSHTAINSIQSVLAGHAEVEKAILYGSRAMGNYRLNSDIDLVLVGSRLTLSIKWKIETELDDLLLPYKIDIAILHNISNQSLLEHIQRAGIIFYQAV